MKKDCAFQMVVEPVCGCNGKTYLNKSEADAKELGITRQESVSNNSI